MDNIDIQKYGEFLKEIHSQIRIAQEDALKAVNSRLVALYRFIGKSIVEKQKIEQWGDRIIERLALDLQKSLPGIKGFSGRNLWRMRDFYLSYGDNEKLTALSAEISWTHNVAILEKSKSALEREFYLRMSRKFGWSYRLLLNNIENQTYEKTLLGQTNFDLTLPETIRDKAKPVVKDEYTFDFLELGQDFSERQLENSLVGRVDDFLKEMGGIFSFVGRQYRIEMDDKEYFLDILLYHRILRCLVIIELKADEFIPEHVGKMQFYLAALDATVKTPEENPSIGIILCKSKKKMTVEYALKESNKPIGVASYTVFKKLPKELQDQLPTAEQIAKLIGKIE